MGKETNKTKWLHIRLNEDEHQRLLEGQRKTMCKKFSDYLRRVIFRQPVIKTYRNISMDEFVAEMMKLNKELNSIGNNFNQVVKKINTYKDEKTIYSLLVAAELDRRQLMKQVEIIKDFIAKNLDKW